MKVIIWGTGASAISFMKNLYSYISSEVQIICFIDSDARRYNSFFFGYAVLSPYDALKLEFDFVVVEDDFYGRSINKIKDDLDPSFSTKIVSRSYIFQQLNDISHFWNRKSILFFGDRRGFELVETRAKYIFNQYDFASKVEDVENVEKYDYIFLCERWLLPYEIQKKRDAHYKKEINSRLKINQNKIVASNIWPSFTRSTEKIEGGELNPEKKFLILSAANPFQGWGVLLLFFLGSIEYARKSGMIPVIDMQNIANQYLNKEELGKRNSWTDYYQQVSNYDLSEVYSSKNVWLDGVEIHNICDSIGNVEYSKLRLQGKVEKHINDVQQNLFVDVKGKVLGVVYRGTDYAAAGGHSRPLRLKPFMDKVSDFLDNNNYEKIFLATEISEVTEKFKKRFGDRVCFTDQKRFSIKERRLLAEVHFNRERDEYTKGLEYLTVLELLSRCDSLVGSSCSAMLVAKEMNMGKYEYYEAFEDKLQILSVSDWRVFLRHCVRYFNKTMNIHEYARPKK